MSKQTWWRVVLEWKLESQDDGTRYAYVTKCAEESTAIFAAINCLIMDGVMGVGDTVHVLECEPHAYKRKHDELEAIP